MIDESSTLTARLIDENDADEEVATEPFSPSAPEDDGETTPLDSLTPVPVDRGEKQPPKFRDWPYALVFLIQFIAIIAVGGAYISDFITVPDEEFDYTTVGAQQEQILSKASYILPSISASAVSALLLLIPGLLILSFCGKSFITISVWTSVAISLAMGISALTAGLLGLGLVSLVFALMGCCYACSVRDRIPFAAANLSAGVAAIKSNGGIVLIVVLFGGLLFSWMVMWTISLFEVMNITEDCNNNGTCDVRVHQPGWAVLWVMFLFWTQQVFKNVIHTTVAGTVGTWYFEPQEASSCCSSGICSSLSRSLTYSFGSICFGSLCVAILQTLDYIIKSMRAQGEGDQNPAGALLLCCLDCIINLLEEIMEYFNKWVREKN